MSDTYDMDGLSGLEIAVIGMAGRFPGARTLDEFWQNLRDGVESVRFFSDEQLLAAGVQPALLQSDNYVRAGGVLQDIEGFDAAFFGFNPSDAALLDPQQRLLLECAWEALEHAGYALERQRGPVGVYAGVGLNTYLLNNICPNGELVEQIGGFQIAIASDKDFLATRVAYKLNLEGPAITVQTACSTSLVAIHLACQGLLSGECNMALAGGVALRVPHQAGYLYQEGGIASPDGHCRPFDANAQGTTFGNGAGVVLLKRLADALRDGDSIHALVKGSAINNDGALKVGYTAPRIDGQAAAIRAALLMAEVDPASVSYVEAHGTGTPLGDPIEVAALKQAFGDQAGAVALGSLKSNIGHLDTAAGVASFIKAVLALKHRQLPPSLHFEQANPRLGLEASPFYVNSRLADWPARGTPRRAGVSSFGIGGTNAHVVLEEAPPAQQSVSRRPAHLLLLSAKTASALDAASAELARYLRQHPALEIADMAATLQRGRRHFDHRRMLVGQTQEQLVAALEGREPQRGAGGVCRVSEAAVAFMFPGQGSQYPGMGRELYELEPVFRASVDRCAQILRPLLGLDLRDLLYARPEQPEQAVARLSQTALAQPALFTVEYALAQLWMAWGVQPCAMIGHSVGEYVAACLAGVFSLEDGLQLVALRGRLVQDLPGGSMLALPLAERDVLPLLGAGVELAAVNAPASCVVAGPGAQLAALAAELSARGTPGRPLHTSHAFHSAMMEPVVSRLIAAIERIELKPPRIPFLSNVSGSWITAEEATDPRYWARHLRQTVRFAAGAELLLGEPELLLLEVGPGMALSTFARQQRPSNPERVVSSMRHPQEPASDWQVLLQAAGRLWLAGVALDWQALYAGEQRRRIPLPTYPFERQRFWISPPSQREQPRARPAAPGAPRELADFFSLPGWQALRLPAREAPLEPETDWLIFADGYGLAERLAALASAAHQRICMVVPGERFARLSQDLYSVDPGQREDYERLIEQLRQGGRSPHKLVYLWGLAPGEPEAAPATLETPDFYSLLWLAQALGKHSAGPRELLVVASHVLQVHGAETISPARATMLGPCRVIPQEYPQISCSLIDIAPPPDGRLAGRLAQQILAELASGLPEAVLAYRGRDRLAQRFEPARLEAAPAFPRRLRQGGVYLITGGLGGVGLELARYLARSAQARLALLGRSPLPERAAWDDWLASHAGDDPAAQKIAYIRELEALGAEVLALSADVADQRQLTAAIAEVEACFGEIHGVIHAAGVAGGGMIQLKTPEMVRQVLAPKLQGTQLLYSLLQRQPLDFFVLCSSLNAIAGGFGLVDYCAANAFQDAFARQASLRDDRFVTAINWDRWNGIGMAASGSAALQAWQHQQSGLASGPEHPLLGRLAARAARRMVFQQTYQVSAQWVLNEHAVAGKATLPGAAYPEMMLAAFRQVAGDAPLEILDLSFAAPLIVEQDERKETLALLEQEDDGYSFIFLSRYEEQDSPGWQEHARARLRPGTRSLVAPTPLGDLQRRCEPIALDAVRQELEGQDPRQFVRRGRRWWSLRQLAAGADERLALLELDEQCRADLDALALHPALLDLATGLARPLEGQQYLPLAYERISVSQALPARLYSHIRYRPGSQQGDVVVCDITLLDAQGQPLVEIAGFTLKQLSDQAVAQLGQPLRQPSAARADWGWLETLHGELQGVAQPLPGLRPEQGVEAFARILDQGEAAQVLVCAGDLRALLEQSAAGGARLAESLAHSALDRPAHPRPQLNTSYAPPADELERAIVEVWQRVLGIEQVGVDDNFFELGGDSLIGIRLVAGLKQALQREIAVVSLFDAPTAGALARQLRAEQAGPASYQHSQERADKKRDALERQRQLARERGARRTP